MSSNIPPSPRAQARTLALALDRALTLAPVEQLPTEEADSARLTWARMALIETAFVRSAQRIGALKSRPDDSGVDKTLSIKWSSDKWNDSKYQWVDGCVSEIQVRWPGCVTRIRAEEAAKLLPTIAALHHTGLTGLSQLHALLLSASRRRLGMALGGRKSEVRRLKGEYYTPRSLARFIVDQTLQLESLTKPEQVLELRVLDMAVGTGVFLMEVAQALAARLTTLSGMSLPEARSQVIGRCLFGVDRDEEALRIARLELMLLGATPGALAEVGTKLRCGDALLGTEASHLPWKLEPDHVLARPLADAWLVRCLEPELGWPSPTLGTEQYLEALRSAGLEQRIRARVALERPIHQWLDFAQAAGGFDAVVGNPPYLAAVRGGGALFERLHRAPRSSVDYQPKGDLYYHFVAQGLRQLAPGGRLGMVIPPYWRTRSAGAGLRTLVAARCVERLRLDFGNSRIFPECPGHHSEVLVLEARSGPPLEMPGAQTGLRRPGLHIEVLDGQLSLDEILARVTTPDLQVDEKIRKRVDDVQKTASREGAVPGHSSPPKSAQGPAQLLLSFPAPLWTLPPACISQGVVMPQATLSAAGLACLPAQDFHIGQGIFWLRDEELYGLHLSRAELAFVKPYLPVEGIRPFVALPRGGWLLYLDPAAARRVGENPKQYPSLFAHLSRFAPVITSVHGPFGLHRAREPRWFEGAERLLVARKTPSMRAARATVPTYVDQGANVILLDAGDQRFVLGLLHSARTDAWLRQRKGMGGLLQVDKDVLCALPLPRVDRPVQALKQKAEAAFAQGGVHALLELAERSSSPRVQARACLERLVEDLELQMAQLWQGEGLILSGANARPGRGGRFYARVEERPSTLAEHFMVLERLVECMYGAN